MSNQTEFLPLDEAADLLKMSADSILHQATAGFLQIYWLLNKTLHTDEMELKPVGQFPAYPGQDLEEWSTNLTPVRVSRHFTYIPLHRNRAGELLTNDSTVCWVTEITTPEETFSLGEDQAFTITRRLLVLRRNDLETFVKPVESSTQGNEKTKGRLNHDPELQARASEIAVTYFEQNNRKPTRNEVAKKLAQERGMNVETVERRIRKQW